MNRLLIAFCLALTVAACASTPASPTSASVLGNCALINPSAPQSNCQNVNASVYNKQQWQTKGATTTSQALQQVSPSVSVH